MSARVAMGILAGVLLAGCASDPGTGYGNPGPTPTTYVNPSPPPESMGGFGLNYEETVLRVDEYKRGTSQPPGIVRIAVYGEHAELLIASTEESLSVDQVEFVLEDSAKKNAGSNLRQVKDGGCIDTVSMQNIVGIHCMLSRDGKLSSVMLIGGDETAALSIANEVLDDW